MDVISADGVSAKEMLSKQLPAAPTTRGASAVCPGDLDCKPGFTVCHSVPSSVPNTTKHLGVRQLAEGQVMSPPPHQLLGHSL